MLNKLYIEEDLLPSIGRSRKKYDNIPRADGMFLAWLVETTCRHRALEIGSANGYSAICIGLGLEKQGGRLITIEKSSAKSALCRLNLQKSGLEKTAECITGNALKVTSDLSGGFDFLFPDLPVNVLPFVQAALQKMSPGYVIVLHNLCFMRRYKKVLDFVCENRLRVENISIVDGYGFFVISHGDIGVDFSCYNR
ncbi:O-methyltransferase [Desulfolutivibrio sp.]|uniref:O-methyltransferase n=1 Tax=Desulfolutivibrio sp. TaxID=2773296 RepID=UPI002F96D0C2